MWCEDHSSNRVKSPSYGTRPVHNGIMAASRPRQGLRPGADSCCAARHHHSEPSGAVRTTATESVPVLARRGRGLVGTDLPAATAHRSPARVTCAASPVRSFRAGCAAPRSCGSQGRGRARPAPPGSPARHRLSARPSSRAAARGWCDSAGSVPCAVVPRGRRSHRAGSVVRGRFPTDGGDHDKPDTASARPAAHVPRWTDPGRPYACRLHHRTFHVGGAPNGSDRKCSLNCVSVATML
jgi:hypothetical protein